jgi:serine phosphatase RsbU (regulator of sigma subunit)
MGMSSLDELRGQDGRQIMDDYIVQDEHGNPLDLEDLPGRKLVAGQEPEPLLMRVVVRASGEVTWRLLKTTALRDRRGRFVGAMTVIEDVTRVKTAELRTRVLAESGRILASSLDYQQTLRNVAEVAVPSLADYCGVDLLGDDGTLERVAAIHRDPAKRELAEALQTIDPWVPTLDTPGGRVALTGTSELFTETSLGDLATMGRSETHLSLIRALGVRSVLIVPMRVPTRTIGLLTLATDALHGGRLGHGDTELAEQLARRAAVAVENSRLHTKLANVAETLQRSLRPSELPGIPGWELASLYRPAQAEHRIDVGGDFYEFVERDGVWFVIVGDVTGRGVAAASMTALLRHGARVASRTEPHPAAILARLDEALRQQPEPSLCTALCLAIHDDHVRLCSAGHPPALLATGDGAVRQVPAPGPMLGAFADASWSEERIDVSPGTMLVLYTDGVTETAGERERFGVERLRELVAANAARGPTELLAVLESTLSAFRSGLERDDVAALALRAR